MYRPAFAVYITLAGMTPAHYRAYYLDLILGTLGGNRAHFAITDETGDATARSVRYRTGLTVLALVSLIEANFLSKQEVFYTF